MSRCLIVDDSDGRIQDSAGSADGLGDGFGGLQGNIEKVEGAGSPACAIDDREHALRRLLPSWPVAHLSVADIHIGKLLIERKAVADLEASILDGRYREQRARLLSEAASNQAHPIYIIEGDLERGHHARLQKSALQKHLTRLTLRYKIAVFRTASIRETAELCQLLADQLATDPTCFDAPPTLSYVEQRGGATRQGNTDDPEVFAVSVLTCVRGVSVAAARAVLAACGGTLAGVWAASAEQLAAVVLVGGKRKLGKAVGGRLWSLLHYSS